jgi:hypothetical protein
MFSHGFFFPDEYAHVVEITTEAKKDVCEVKPLWPGKRIFPEKERKVKTEGLFHVQDGVT